MFLSMKASSITADLLKLQSCLQAVKAWFAENEPLLNADKSDVMCVGTSAQLNVNVGTFPRRLRNDRY